jgi:hypothetical protein
MSRKIRNGKNKVWRISLLDKDLGKEKKVNLRANQVEDYLLHLIDTENSQPVIALKIQGISVGISGFLSDNQAFEYATAIFGLNSKKYQWRITGKNSVSKVVTLKRFCEVAKISF